MESELSNKETQKCPDYKIFSRKAEEEGKRSGTKVRCSVVIYFLQVLQTRKNRLNGKSVTGFPLE
jgi:hypothetical protein